MCLLLLGFDTLFFEIWEDIIRGSVTWRFVSYYSPSPVEVPEAELKWLPVAMIYSTRRRYVVVTIFLTSVFWLTVELILLSYTNRLNDEQTKGNLELPEAWNSRQSYENHPIADVLIPIEDFRALYVTSIPPNPDGPGEAGKAVYNDKDDPLEVGKEKEGYSKYSFNELASAKISLERSIPDNRPQE